MSLPTLRALLVGITKYDTAPLYGCVNDVKLVHEFLQEQHDPSEMQLEVKTLINQEAKRQDFIDTFLSFFKNLKDGDIPLFYFSGHGSDMRAPKEFWYSTPRKRMETLVLQDSRTKDGWDLADKELAYLIWKVTHNKNVMMTIIIDSCHAGDVTRELNEQGRPANHARDKDQYHIRHAEDSKKSRTWDQLLGNEEYINNGNKVTVPKGNYVSLAACREDEYSIEKVFDRKQYHGVFTYCLIKAIRQSRGQINYSDLMQFAQSIVYKESSKQHPQISPSMAGNAQKAFLGQALKAKADSNIVFYNFNARQERGLPVGWLIKSGSLNGLTIGTQQEAGKLLLFYPPTFNPEDAHIDNALAEATIIEVLTDHSLLKVTPFDELDKTQEFTAIFTSRPIPSMAIAFADDCDPVGKDILNKVWQTTPSYQLELIDDPRSAQYLLHAWADQFWTRKYGEEESIFQKITGYNQGAAQKIFTNLEEIASWNRVKDLKNPQSRIKRSYLDLAFYEMEVITEDLYPDAQQQRIEDFETKAPVLNYHFDEEITRSLEQEVTQPRFRFKIRHGNNSRFKRLWFSLLFLGSNFRISNELLSLQALDRGQEKWVEYFDPNLGADTTLIPLEIEQAYLDRKIFEITEHFKLIVSNHEFNTDSLSQEGLEFEELTDEEPTRGLGVSKKSKQKIHADWNSFDFRVRVKYENPHQ